jgi:hypothetical protein
MMVDKNGNLVPIALDPNQRNVKGDCMFVVVCSISARGADGKVETKACFILFCRQMSITTPSGETITYDRQQPNMFSGSIPVETGGTARDSAVGTQGISVARDVNGRGRITVTGTGAAYDGYSSSYTIYDRPSRPGQPYVAHLADRNGAPYSTSCVDGCRGALSNGVQTDNFVIAQQNANAQLIARDMAGNPARITCENCLAMVQGHEGWTVVADGNGSVPAPGVEATEWPFVRIVSPSASNPHGEFVIGGQTGSITLPDGRRIESRVDENHPAPQLSWRLAGAISDTDGIGGYLECTGLCAEPVRGDAAEPSQACGPTCILDSRNPTNNDRVCTAVCTMRDQSWNPADPKAPNGYFFASMIEDGQVSAITPEGDPIRCAGAGCYVMIKARDANGNNGASVCSTGASPSGSCSGANREGDWVSNRSYKINENGEPVGDDQPGEWVAGGIRILYHNSDGTHAGISCGGPYCLRSSNNAYGWKEGEEWRGDIDNVDFYEWKGNPDASWLLAVDANSEQPVFGADSYLRPSLHNATDNQIAKSLGQDPNAATVMLPPLSVDQRNSLTPAERERYDQLAGQPSNLDLAFASVRVLEAQSTDRYLTLQTQRTGGQAAAASLADDIDAARQGGVTSQELAALETRLAAWQPTVQQWAHARDLVDTIDRLTWVPPTPATFEAELASNPELVAELAQLRPIHPADRVFNPSQLERARSNVQRMMSELSEGNTTLTASLYLQAEAQDLRHQMRLHQEEINQFNIQGGTALQADLLNQRSDELNGRWSALEKLLGPVQANQAAATDDVRALDMLFADTSIDQEWAGRVRAGDALIDRLTALTDQMTTSGDPNQIALAADVGVLSQFASLDYDAITRSDGQRAQGADLTMRLPSSGLPDVVFAQTAAINLPGFNHYPGEDRAAIDLLPDYERVALASRMTATEYLDSHYRPQVTDPDMQRRLLEAEFTDIHGNIDQAKVNDTLAAIQAAGGRDGEVLAVSMVLTEDGSARGSATMFVVRRPDGSVKFVKGGTFDTFEQFQTENELYSDDMTFVLAENYLDVAPVRTNSDGTVSYAPGGEPMRYGTAAAHVTPTGSPRGPWLPLASRCCTSLPELRHRW